MNLENKKVLVTGADGFIGSHLVERLLEERCLVRATVFYNSLNTLGWLEDLPKESLSRVEVIPTDIRDPYAARSAVRNMDLVFHLAALISIPFSYKCPDAYVDTNIRGTLNILSAARDASPEKLLITSSSEVYGTAKYVPIDENHPLQGQSPYSATKIAADRLAESFYRSFEVPLVIVRPFNTFGPRQSARAIIPTLLTQLLSGRKIIRVGNLGTTRDFVYVKDTVDGFIEIAKSDLTLGQEINVATGQEISIGDLARDLIRSINPSARTEQDLERVRPAESEVERLVGDNRKLRSITAWKQTYSFKEGLEKTIQWFRIPGVLQRYKPEAYSV